QPVRLPDRLRHPGWLRIACERDPDTHRLELRSVEAAWGDTDDRVALVIEPERLPDHRRIGAELRAPEVVAQHRDRGALPNAILVGRVEPAQLRPETDDRPIVRARVERVHLPASSRAADVAAAQAIHQSD